jgi:PiT family inorganic phosphate transporter
MLRRVLSPHIAVAWAAFFNFIAFLFFGLHVAQTIGTGIRVVLACQIAMGLGTLIGGWRIVRTMGSRITRLKPVQGFCAETAGAATLYLATSFGVPVSTTHTITGAITGVGAARRVSAVRWGVAGSIVIAWITLPAAGFIGALFYALAKAVS